VDAVRREQSEQPNAVMTAAEPQVN
jgi:hypothetical protein